MVAGFRAWDGAHRDEVSMRTRGGCGGRFVRRPAAARRIRWAGWTAAALLLLAGAAAAQETAPAAPQAGVLLVDTSEEADEMFAQAAAAIRAGDADKAVDLLQALITFDKPALRRHPEDPRRHVFVGDAATGLGGMLPPEGLKLYRRLYGRPAEKLYEEARRTLDEPSLRRVSREYFHTPGGEAALNLLGVLAFERGAYLDAADAWETLYRTGGPRRLDRPTLLAKAAAACHLAGAQPQAQELRKLLAASHPGARGTVAGQVVNLSDFVDRSLAAAPALRPAPRRPVTLWASQTGSADAMAVMPACAAPMLPLWTQPPEGQQEKAQALLGLGKTDGAVLPAAVDATVSSGRVVLRCRDGGTVRTFEASPLIHPLVLGETIVCRWADEVSAASMATGKELWRTSHLPVYRTTGGRRGQADNHFLPLADDMGRYALTFGDGRFYTVCKFRRIDPGTYRKFGTGDAMNSSTLAALTVTGGRADVAWEIGNGKGQGELVPVAKYLTAPTYHRGRLYVLARFGNRYHAMCLAADTGALVWQTPVGPLPTTMGEALSWQAEYVTEILTERASCATVVDGRLYMTTNAGLVFALDADSGRPLWTYRYDSEVSGRAFDKAATPVEDRAFQLFLAKQPLPPQNPLLVAGGRLICLPCDGEAVLSLQAASGRLLWETPRAGQRDLAAIDDGRVLLSGPDLIVLSAATGEVLKRFPSDVLGRPAVTPEAVIASGRDRIVRLDLDQLTLTADALGLAAGRPVLGRLISSQGRLVSASAAGLTTYFDYEKAWTLLTERAAAAREPAKRFELHLLRGRFAFRAGRLKEASEALRAAEQTAKKARDNAAIAQVRPRLLELLLRQAATGEDKEVGRLLAEARRYAAGAADEACILARMVRHHEAFGRPEQAVAEAQRLSEDYADVEVPDPDAPGNAPPVSGWALGRRELARLIDKHGRRVYEAFDRKLAEAFGRAAPGEDVEAMLAARRRWPEAAQCGKLLLTAGEILYRRGTAGQPAKMELVQRAARVLAEAKGCPDPSVRLSARAGQMLIDRRFRPVLAAVNYADLRAADAAAKVRFADFAGTVASLVKAADAAVPAGPPYKAQPFCSLGEKLRLVYQITEGRPAILRDTRDRPVRAGERVFCHGDDAVTCLDTERDDPPAAQVWRVSLGRQSAVPWRTGQLSEDHRLLAVIDPRRLMGIEVAGGQVRYNKPLRELGLSSCTSVLADGDWAVLSGPGAGPICVHLPSGQQAWTRRSNLRDVHLAGEILAGIDWRRGGPAAWDVRTAKDLAVARPRDHGLKAWALTPDGLVAAIYSARVAAADPRRGQSGLIGEAPFECPTATVLGVDRRFVAVDAGQAGEVKVFDLADLAKPVTLKLPGEGKGTGRAVRAVPVGMRVYVLWGDSPGAAKGPARYMLRGPALTAFELPSAAVLWTVRLAHAGPGDYLVAGPHACGGTVSLLAAAIRRGGGSRHIVIRAGDGKVIDCNPLGRQDAAERAASPRSGGCPVVLNGRVLVEQAEGITLLRIDL